MRAVVCERLGPPSALRVGEFPDPEVGPGDVLIRVAASGVNFPDSLIIQGKYQTRPDLPFVPGGEASGIVEAVGEGVRKFKPGDRVVGLESYGSFAELMCVREHKVIRLSDDMEFDVAAGFCLTYGTSYFALKQRAQLQPGETVAVLGAAGGVGLAAVEIAKAMGARVIAAASSQEKLEIARRHGADDLINYNEESLKERLKSLTGGAGVDVVYDPVGGELAEQALRATAWDGRFCVIGFASGQIPRIPLNLTLLKNNAIVGVFWGAWVEKYPEESQQNFDELFDFL